MLNIVRHAIHPSFFTSTTKTEFWTILQECGPEVQSRLGGERGRAI